jgi:septum formation protein
LLERLQIPHEALEPGVKELARGEPKAVARCNALAKARAGAAARPGRLILAADTVVALDREIYDKPTDAAQARATLRALAGRTHTVIGALVLIGEGEHCALTTTTVRMREHDPDLIEWYLASGEWRGRAGGYAIQGAGAALVREIEGDYENVVGLSVAALLDLLPRLLYER